MARKKKTAVATPKAAVEYVTQSSPLLALPPELKNQIFEYVCSDTTMMYPHRPNKKVTAKEDLSNGKPEPPGFMLACKQIYYESIEVLYATAKFDFYSTSMLKTWICTISLAHLKLVQNAAVMIQEYPIRPIEIGSLVIGKNKLSPVWQLKMVKLGGLYRVIAYCA